MSLLSPSSMRDLINAGLLAASFMAPAAGYGADELRLDVPVLPEFRKYQGLLAYPGYVALALENNGLSPSPGSKLVVSERGRGIQLPNGTLKFTGRKGQTFSYEVGVLVGTSNLNTQLTFPVVVDASQLESGKMKATLKLPLARLLPDDFKARLNRKVAFVAGADTQAKVLAYLEQLRKQGSGAVEMTSISENILVDAYNRSSGPGGRAEADQDLVRQDQWSLITTFVLWLLLVTALLAVYVRRKRHGKSA